MCNHTGPSREFSRRPPDVLALVRDGRLDGSAWPVGPLIQNCQSTAFFARSLPCQHPRSGPAVPWPELDPTGSHQLRAFALADGQGRQLRVLPACLSAEVENLEMPGRIPATAGRISSRSDYESIAGARLRTQAVTPQNDEFGETLADVMHPAPLLAASLLRSPHPLRLRRGRRRRPGRRCPPPPHPQLQPPPACRYQGLE